MNNEIENKKKANTIVKHLSNKESALDFLNKNEIAEVNSIVDIQEYKRGDDRQGLIMKLIENEMIDPIKVIVDVKNGQPSVDQVYDTIYDIGTGCTKRVIVYTGSVNYSDHNQIWSNIDVVENLLNEMEQYPGDLYLVNVLDILDSEGVFNFEVINEPNKNSIIDKNNMLSEIEFLQEDFWQLHYYPLDQDLYGIWEPYSNGFFHLKGTGFHADLGNFEVKIKWLNKGLFFYVKENNNAIGELKSMWNDGHSQFKKLFRGCEMCFKDGAQNGSELEIQLWNLPITYLASASRYEKEYCAKFIKSSFSKFILYFEFNFIDIY
jgi:hypothetical protein